MKNINQLIGNLYAAYRRRLTPPLFNGEKAKTLLGRGDALRPRPTFEAKSRQKPY